MSEYLIKTKFEQAQTTSDPAKFEQESRTRDPSVHMNIQPALDLPVSGAILECQIGVALARMK